MSDLIVTPVLAALVGLLVFTLALATVVERVRTGHPVGDGGDVGLARTIRAHANLIEYAPMFLILLALLEASGVGRVALVALGAAFVTSRLAYVVYAFISQALPLRIVGFWASAGPILVAAIWLLAR